MKALFIGGTGTISTAITNLAVDRGIELTLLNRGNNIQDVPKGVRMVQADINDEENVKNLLNGMHFDVVADFIGMIPSQIERDIRLFSGKTNQYIYISSASAYRENGFPITIVRPSHTYGDKSVPVALHGSKGSWQVLDRIRSGKPVIVHGDGLSLWTFTHNTDFAKAFVGLMNNPHAIGEAVHITSDESVTWNAAYDTIGRILGVGVNKVHIASDFLTACNPELGGGLLGDKSNSVVFDNSKIKRLVPEYTATMRFDQGIKRTIAYVLGHEECQIPDPQFDTWCDRVISAYKSIKI